MNNVSSNQIVELLRTRFNVDWDALPGHYKCGTLLKHTLAKKKVFVPFESIFHSILFTQKEVPTRRSPILTLSPCLISDKEVEVERRVVASSAWEELEKAGGDIVLLLHAKNFDPRKFPEFSNCFEIEDEIASPSE
jgi:hypothetical protein